jgi:uncharacterized protein
VTEPVPTVISIRGDATIEVQPDLGTLHCELIAVEDDKPTALATAARHLDAVRSDLAGLGGVPRTSSEQRAPLSWLARSARTSMEYDHVHDRRSGRVIAEVDLRIELRDVDLLNAVAEVLSAQPTVSIDFVSWSVDEDNPTWSDVRARAIDVAIQRGRDYAAALGGTLASIDHIADSGLLASANVSSESFGRRSAMSVSSGETKLSSGVETPTLDPDPISVSAVIEARFTASVRPL